MLGRVSDERGISAVIVVVCILAIFGAAMLSVDAGQLWTARRNAVTATDASALAQARYFAVNAKTLVGTCTPGVWDTTLDANVNDTFDTTCTVKNVAADGSSGVVVVSTRKRSPARFSGVLGIGDSAAFSMSAAMWGFVQPIGLRPIALCINDPHVQDALLLGGLGVETHPNLLTAPNDYLTNSVNSTDTLPDYAQTNHLPFALPGPGVVHHVDFTASQCDSASGVAGNFGWIDLDSGFGSPYTNNTSGQNPPEKTCADPQLQSQCGTSDWLEFGYYGNHVTLPGDCATEVTGQQNCLGDTGTSGSNGINEGLCFLMGFGEGVNNCMTGAGLNGIPNPLTVPVILYDTAGASGSNAEFHIVAIANVRIWAYHLSGNNRYLDLEFMQKQTDGICCSAGAGSLLPKGTKICDVDHDAQDPSLTAARCVVT